MTYFSCVSKAYNFRLNRTSIHIIGLKRQQLDKHDRDIFAVGYQIGAPSWNFD